MLLITLYLAVCHHWQEGGWVQAQRHAPCVNLDLTNGEVVTIDLFAIALEQKRQIKEIHQHAGRYWQEWFPRLPSYGLCAVLEPACGLFPALLERFCKSGETVSFAGLVDSMPVILARQRRRFNAKVAPELASSGYCPTPSPRFIGLAPAGLNDGPELEQVAHALPDQELYADNAYEYLKRAHRLPFTVMAPRANHQTG